MAKRTPDRVVDYDTVNQIDWARLAAYIDGEGCIRIHQNSPHRKTGMVYHGVMVIIAQRGPELTDWLVETFGGFSYQSKGYPTRVAMHYWRVSTIQSYEILKRCRPYMIVKGEQADVAIEYRETTQSTTRKLPQEVHLRREALKLKLYALKHGHKAKVEISGA